MNRLEQAYQLLVEEVLSLQAQSQAALAEVKVIREQWKERPRKQKELPSSDVDTRGSAYWRGDSLPERGPDAFADRYSTGATFEKLLHALFYWQSYTREAEDKLATAKALVADWEAKKLKRTRP